jgi:hypothetical protein
VIIASIVDTRNTVTQDSVPGAWGRMGPGATRGRLMQAEWAHPRQGMSTGTTLESGNAARQNWVPVSHAGNA